MQQKITLYLLSIEKLGVQATYVYSSIILAFVEFLYQLAGTDSNPFALDALAVFMFRVLQRVNHPVLNRLSLNVTLSIVTI